MTTSVDLMPDGQTVAQSSAAPKKLSVQADNAAGSGEPSVNAEASVQTGNANPVENSQDDDGGQEASDRPRRRRRRSRRAAGADESQSGMASAESFDTPGELTGAQTNETPADQVNIETSTALQAPAADDGVAPNRKPEEASSSLSLAVATPAAAMQTEPLTQTPPQPDADPVAQVQAGALPQTRDGPPSEAKPAELAPIEAKPAELAPIDLRASISQAGLELIETNKQSEPELQDAPPRPRVVRQRKPIAKTEEEPLQMVETSRKA
jgi:ribonuclease E